MDAPSQLMWLNVGDIRRQIDKHAGKNASRSLYAHFFSAKEEAGIYGRLAGLTDGTPPMPLRLLGCVEARRAAFGCLKSKKVEYPQRGRPTSSRLFEYRGVGYAN